MDLNKIFMTCKDERLPYSPFSNRQGYLGPLLLSSISHSSNGQEFSRGIMHDAGLGFQFFSRTTIVLTRSRLLAPIINPKSLLSTLEN
jgi:hypothetical protein